MIFTETKKDCNEVRMKDHSSKKPVASCVAQHFCFPIPTCDVTKVAKSWFEGIACLLCALELPTQYVSLTCK